jgi:hypothetical protein
MVRDRVLERVPLRVGVGVGLVAGAVLALQVLLTRLFSAALFYHFTFLSISLALLGAGAGAIAVYVRPAWFERRRLEDELAWWAALTAVLLAIVPIVLARIHYGRDDVIHWDFVLSLGLTCVLSTVLFLAAGIVISLAVRGYTAGISRLYAFDLTGAALGAVAVVPLMWVVAVPTLIVALAPVAAVAAVLFTGGRPGAVRNFAAGGAAIAAAAVLVASVSDFYEPAPANDQGGKGRPALSDRWTPLARVLGYDAPRSAVYGLVWYDRLYAPVPQYRGTGPMPDWRRMKIGPPTIGYEMGGKNRALVIGGGGGRDIYNALSSGVKNLDVIELNRGIRDTVDGPLRSFSGHPYSRPGVHTTVGDGRSELANRDTHYDVIHIGFTDTFSAGTGQAFALTENNLYTTEAFSEYFDHLNPNGVLVVSRIRRLLGDEALRATVLTLEALRKRGVEHPERNVVVVLGKDIYETLFGTILARNRPWTPAELDRIRRLARERGEGVAFAPGGPNQLEGADLARAKSPQAFCESYRLDVCAPTDDKPFFFQMRRLGSLGERGQGYLYATDPFSVLLVTVGILIALSLVLVAAPLLLTARRTRPPARSLGFFAAIGLGFLTLEIVLIQRFVLFLGFPTYALSVVLFALLLWTGAGSLLAGRLGDPRRTLTVSLALACGLIAAGAYGLHPLLQALIGLPFAARVALTVLMLAPAGLLLGMAMPLGLTRLAGLYPGGVAWAWGINGIASVVASAGAVTIAILFGFPVATLVALGCYLVALALALTGPWPGRRPVTRFQREEPRPREPAAAESA